MNRKTTRRQFLGRAAGSLAAAQAGHQSFQRAVADPIPAADRVYDCVVLGAGIAGLTAARELQAAGRSVLVLEGSNRLGGRIYTVQDPQLGVLELGAEYIHRPPGSVPLWNEVRRYHLPTQAIPKMAEGRIYEPEFADLPLRGRLRRPGFAALRSGPMQVPLMLTKLENYEGPDQTPRQWIDRHYAPSPLQADFAAMLLTGHLPGTLDDLSVRGFRADGVGSQMLDRDEHYLTRGYHSLIQETARGLTVETNHVVENVRQEGQLFTVNARNGQSARSFRARTVLCTFSIGMLHSLRQHAPDFFSPSLPAVINAALSRIQGGHQSKIVLVFRSCFWPERLAMLHNPSRARRAGRTYFRPFYPDSRRPVLTAYLLAEDAIRLDALSQADAVREVCADLTEIFGVDALAQLRYSYRWRWKIDDPFAHGGFSYLTVEGDPAMPVERARATLADARLTAPLFFAGEATAVETQPASVHGAHTSGLRAAIQIGRYLRDGRVLALAETTAAIRQRI